MNYLWAFMILGGVVFSAFYGTLPAVTGAVLDSAKEAVTLCITMAGVMSFWMGLMRIAEKCGMIADLSRKLKPVLRFLFPKIPPDHIANEYIATNMIANVFGLGWAATPAGLKAMESLEKLEESRREQQQMKVLRIQNENTRTRAQRTQNKKINPMPRGTANDEMCTFLIINISSLQLIPVNIIAYRSQYGSVNPAEIIGPAILATAISTLTGVIFCKFAQIFVK